MSLAIRKSSGHAVRVSAPRPAPRLQEDRPTPAQEETARLIEGMSFEEIWLIGRTDHLPERERIRIEAARRFVGSAEQAKARTRERRKEFNPHEVELHDLDQTGNV